MVHLAHHSRDHHKQRSIHHLFPNHSTIERNHEQKHLKHIGRQLSDQRLGTFKKDMDEIMMAQGAVPNDYTLAGNSTPTGKGDMFLMSRGIKGIKGGINASRLR